jgi:hypothetical protein
MSIPVIYGISPESAFYENLLNAVPAVGQSAPTYINMVEKSGCQVKR